MPVSGDKIRVGFLGAGRMAAALAKGLVSADFAAADSLIASDPLAGGSRCIYRPERRTGDGVES